MRFGSVPCVFVCRHTSVAASTSQLLNKSDDDGMKMFERGNCMWSYIPTDNKRSDVRMRNLLLSEVLLRRFPVWDYRDEG